MPYATLQDLAYRYGTALLVSLTDRAAVPTGAIDAAVVARALADAEATIDGYLAGRYALPLGTVPGLVADLARAIAIYKLHLSAPDPKIKDDHDQAMRTLRDIAAGTVKLGVAGVETPSTGGTGARITDRERPLTAENLKGFI